MGPILAWEQNAIILLLLLFQPVMIRRLVPNVRRAAPLLSYYFFDPARSIRKWNVISLFFSFHPAASVRLSDRRKQPAADVHEVRCFEIIKYFSLNVQQIHYQTQLLAVLSPTMKSLRSLGMSTFRTYIPRRSNGNSATSFFHQGEHTDGGGGTTEQAVMKRPSRFGQRAPRKKKGASHYPTVSW